MTLDMLKPFDGHYLNYWQPDHFKYLISLVVDRKFDNESLSNCCAVLVVRRSLKTKGPRVPVAGLQQGAQKISYIQQIVMNVPQ